LLRIALVLVAAALFGLPSAAYAARPRHSCSKVYTKYLPSVVSLSATTFSPGCGGAALMADDIYTDASKRFPRSLPETYVAYAHGTNRAGDLRAVYPCKIRSTFVKTRDGGHLHTTAFCLNVKGDSFTYVFDMA
jgi:hypothetical protein